jgi:hypothetical protein
VNAGGAIIVMSTFAAIWWMTGAAQFGRGSLIMYAVGIAISALMVVLGWRRRGRSAARDASDFHHGLLGRLAYWFGSQKTLVPLS